MSEENVAIFRQAFDAYNRGDKAAWVGLCDPEYENVPPDEWPEAALIRGPEAVWDFFVSNMEPWEESSIELGELIDAGGDKVVAEQRTEVRGRLSGARATWRYWVVATYRNRKAVRSEWFSERAEALEAAGLSE